MTMEPGWALQKGLYETLAADAGLIGLLGGSNIYDDVPDGASFPYVTFGQTLAEDWGTATEEGREHLVTLHVWSRAAGRKEAQGIIGAIEEALAAGPIAIDDHALINLRYEFSEARRDPDGLTIHGIVRYRVVTEPAGG